MLPIHGQRVMDAVQDVHCKSSGHGHAKIGLGLAPGCGIEVGGTKLAVAAAGLPAAVLTVWKHP